MKQQLAISMAALILLTSGASYFNGETLLGVLSQEKQRKASKKEDERAIVEYNIYDQPQPKSNPVPYHGGFFSHLDFLYWRANEEGLQYATVSTLNATLAKSTNRVKSPKVKWGPGFRLGAGYTFAGQDYWDLNAIWTRFQTEQTGSTATDGTLTTSRLTPWWGSSVLGTNLSRASVSWKLTYNVYDVVLGRDYFIAKTMTVHPFIGLRGTTIDQRYHAHYDAIMQNTVVPTSFHASNNLWGLGAHIGGGLDYHVTAGFAIIGKVGGSLLYGDFKVNETTKGLQVYQTSQRLYTSTYKNNITTAVVNLNAMLGFQWEKFFYDKRYRLSIKAGYEWNEWFSQNRMFREEALTTSTSNEPALVSIQNNGNLTLQGATVQARWDF